ncbi:hypothetical protein FRX31_017247, partial [Thalictrum thalictroides]
TPELVQMEFAHILGMPIATTPLHYLGLPLTATRLLLRDCQPLINKFKKKITGWKTKLMYYAGRLVMINAVLTSTRVYWAIRPRFEKLSWTRIVWNKHITPKHAFISWLAMQEALMTQDKLLKWGTLNETNCVLCNKEYGVPLRVQKTIPQSIQTKS